MGADIGTIDAFIMNVTLFDADMQFMSQKMKDYTSKIRKLYIM